ncbi:hypothetical protein EGR_06286 [Echinococcus granulosus]|uniref:Uncharacterized protein n=1 Tax=Echinococcus granulosus TaxID=6210 RepID=W6UL80_ECHGR|nr:hypothetical protein EGR_06286 [Echinococcus granulosus]EUB58862.1 hypothetical protein EGR_06286 [Echinococcus granulosus]
MERLTELPKQTIRSRLTTMLPEIKDSANGGSSGREGTVSCSSGNNNSNERIHSSTFITPSTHHIHSYHHFTAAIAHHPHPPTTTPPLTINDDAFTITSSKSLPFSDVFSSIIQPYHIFVDSLHDFPLKSTLTKRLCPLVTCYTRDAAVSLHSVAEADEVHFAQLYLIFAGGQHTQPIHRYLQPPPPRH